MDSFSNAYQTTLNGSIDNSQTTLVVTSTTGKPPSVPFRLRIKAEGANTNEIVTVIGVSGTTYTIIRASEAYNGVQTASAHASGATVEHVLTAGVMTNLSGLAGVKGTYLGTTTPGPSFFNMNGGYAKKVTVSATGLIASIDAYMKGNASNAAALSVFVLSDNAGTPYRVIASNVFLDTATPSPAFTEYLDTNARWVAKPINAWVEPGTYWIVVTGGYNNGGTQLAYDTGGSDYNHSGQYASDHATQSYSAQTTNYSIRALFIEATATTVLGASGKVDTGGADHVPGGSWADVDATNCGVSVTTNGGPLLVGASGIAGNSGGRVYLDIAIDGTRVGNTERGLYESNTNGEEDPYGITALVTGLTAGVHTVRLQAKSTSGSPFIEGGSAAGANSSRNTVWAVEFPTYQPTPVGAGSRVLLDYTKTSDDTGTSLPAATWTDIVPNQTFNVVSALSTVEFNVRSFIQVRDTGGGETYDQGRLVIDSGGTPIYEYFGGELINDNQYWDIKFKGNVYKQGLSAGSHTVKAQLLANGGGDFYNRATTSAPYEFFRMQVIEHSNAGDLNTSISPFVRGAVSSSGTIVRGSGFSVAKPGTGHYVITFSPAFVLIPVVVVTTSPDVPAASNGQYAQIEQDTLTVSNLDIWTIQGTTGNAFDCAFNFIAMTVA